MDRLEKIAEKKSSTKKMYEYVFEYFSDQILSGQLKQNDKIPTEREIAEQLGCSRNSIREVMHLLEINGLIECIQGSGNYVRCNPQDFMLKTVNMAMTLMNIEYKEVFHIRTGYEMVALHLAIEAATEEDIESVREALLQMEKAESPEQGGYWDKEFHQRLIHASHNRLLILFSTMIREMTNRQIAEYHERIQEDPEKAARLQRSHWNIYDALVTKDDSSGALAMNQHFEIARQQMEG